MKAYYTSPVKFNQEDKDILEIVKKVGQEVNIIVADSIYSRFSSLDEYQNLNDDEQYELYKKAEKNLKDADIVIANVTHHSNRIGYEIANALMERKPVIALFRQTSDNKLLPPVQGNTSKYLSVCRFNSTNELAPTLKQVLIETKKKIDTKFILIISPEIDRYLEWTSQERRMHKAQVVREAVQTTMEKDKDYQGYLKDRAA